MPAAGFVSRFLKSYQVGPTGRALMLASVSLLQGCVTVSPYPSEWPALQRERVIHAPPPHGPDLFTACPLIAGTYENLGLRFPADAPPLTLTDFFPHGSEDPLDIRFVRIEQTEGTLTITLTKKDGASVSETFRRADIRKQFVPPGVGEYSCGYDLGTKDLGFEFSDLRWSSVAGGVGVLFLVEAKVTFMRTAADSSLVVTKMHAAGVLPAIVLEHTHYRYSAVGDVLIEHPGHAGADLFCVGVCAIADHARHRAAIAVGRLWPDLGLLLEAHV